MTIQRLQVGAGFVAGLVVMWVLPKLVNALKAPKVPGS